MELEYIIPDIVYKVVIIGDSYSGKSSILNRYINDSFNNTFTHTIGVDFFIKNINLSDKKVKIQLWDTAGQEQYATIIRAYFTNCTAAIIVYDISNRDSFNKVEKWLNTFAMNFTENRPCILVGNKTDLSSKREISTQEGQAKAFKLKMDFIECSTKENINIDEIFSTLSNKILFLIDNENFTPTSFNGLKICSQIQNNSRERQSRKCCIIS